jgi:hypothetical protein
MDGSRLVLGGEQPPSTEDTAQEKRPQSKPPATRRETFAGQAPRLRELGFHPIPVDGKRPVLDAWTTPLDEAQLDAAVEAHPAANVGVLTAGLAVIDVDVLDDELAKGVRAWLTERIGEPRLWRVGRAPKFALFCRAAEDSPRKRSSTTWVDARGQSHKLEILGDGQQVVAYGTHPDTRQAYRWPNLDPLATNTAADALPTLDDQQAVDLFRFFDAQAAQRGWTSKGRTSSGNADGGAPTAMGGIDLDLTRSMLAVLDPDCSYDDWVRVGMALHQQFDGAPEALALWDEWSAQGGKYESNAGANDPRAKWESFNAARLGGVSIRSVMRMAEDTGRWVRPPGVEGAPASADEFPSLEEPRPPNDAKEIKVEGARFAEACGWPPATQLIEELLAVNQVSVVAGPANTGKSALMLDIARGVALGEPWQQRSVLGGAVVYFSWEAAGTMAARFRALRACDALGDDTPIWLARPRWSLLAEDAPRRIMDEVQAAQQAFGQQARLLIIDTLAAATPGLRENTSEDMGRVVSRLRALAETGPWHVMVAHHTGKAAEAGLRGHSSLIGAIDTAIMLERLPAADRGVRAAWERQRDLDSRGFSVTFRVVGAETGVFTNFGRPETAALIEYVAAPLSELEGLGERPRQLLELVQTAIAQQPDQTLDAGGWTTVVEQWELETGLLEGSDNAQRVALKRARASLERAQLLLIDRHAGSGRIRSVRLGDGLFPEAPENG